MYAQVVAGNTPRAAHHELERLIRERVLPALRQQDGFSGMLHLVGSDNDHTMTIVCWETQQQANQPLHDYADSNRETISAFAAISPGCEARISVWEVDARA